MAKKVQEINASSMADIAFLLLIFFLVTTTMNVDSGIQRVLPPINKEKDDKGVDTHQRNILLVFVNAQDQLLVGGQRIELYQLTDKVKEFIVNPANSPDLPEKEEMEIDLIGKFPVSKGVVSLQNDRGTSYEMYIKVQNELTRAFNNVRDEVAVEKFGKRFADLAEDQRGAVQKAIPLKVSEAEPRNVGGK